MEHPLASLLRPRLTRAGAAEKQVLLDCLGLFHLSEEPDRRFLTHSPQEILSSSSAYRAVHATDPADPDAARFWNTRLPSKVWFFGWLVHHERLNTRAHMLYRNMCKPKESHCESCPGILETADHLFLHCPCARAVWDHLGIAIGDDVHRHPWLLGCELQLPDTVQADVMLLLLWHIWKAWNAVIFDKQASSHTDILRRLIKDMEMYGCRYKKLRFDFDRWKSYFLSRL